MVSPVLSPTPKQKFFDNNGVPINGGKLFTYVAGSTTKTTSYQDSTGSVQNANPILLNSRGECNLWLDPAVSYKFVLAPSNDTDPPSNPIWTVDNITGNWLQQLLAASSGSSLIGFIQSGTGAVARNVQAKLRDAVNVKDFGAVGDGVTDDTAAINAAIATNKRVYLPAGKYKIGNLAVTQGGGPGSGTYGGGIFGDGQGATILLCGATGNAITITNAWSYNIEKLTVQTSGTYRGISGQKGIVTAGNTSNCMLRDIEVIGFDGGGIAIVGTVGNQQSGNKVENVWLQANGGAQLQFVYANDFTISNIDAGYYPSIAHASFGLQIQNSGEGYINDTRLWNNNIGLQEINGIGNRYVGCRVELSDTQNVWLQGGTDSTITGCRFHTPSQASNGASDNFYATNIARLNVVGCNINTWNATYGRWGVNFDTGCDYITFKGNTIGGFDATNFGPIRFDGGIQRVDGDMVLNFTATSVAANTTSYLSLGNQTSEAAAYNAINRRYAVGHIYFATDVAPGVSQSFTYTMRKNGADTAMTCASSGGASLSAGSTSIAPELVYDAGDFLSAKLVTSAGAAVANHRAYAVLIAY